MKINKKSKLQQAQDKVHAAINHTKKRYESLTKIQDSFEVKNTVVGATSAGLFALLL